ncbi:MAG TPA: elongation factor G [Rectinema sp.]|jgi:elongation factor G|nr:elongation factor G [Spirochaetia bacterium]MDI9427619.1 elongation factor G [Spirochaetota bacterium]NLH90514.1 elongation factor G [Treponema sp.]OQC74499.1 MAG: Elongation factor G [Spirochaetes bacterium ADurb.Bin001]HNP92600.1 elongation factor G [Rectinema sp.]
MSYTTEQIRNIAIIGHGSTGKTTLLEHILFQGGMISRPETVDSGKTVSDYSEDEIARKISVRSSLTHVNTDGYKINFIDAPGSGDFVGEAILAIRSTEAALLVIDGKSGVQIETVKLWRILERHKRPRMMFITRLDEDRADFSNALADIKEKFRVTPVPVTIPMGEGFSFKGIIDVLNNKAYMRPVSHDQKEVPSEVPPEYSEAVESARALLSEAAAEGNDDLMEKYLLEGELTQEETLLGLKEALAEGKIIPAFAGAGFVNSGTAALMDFIFQSAPSPFARAPEKAKDQDGNDVEISIDPLKPASAYVFKTQIDQFSGRLSYIKAITGTILSDIEMVVSRDLHRERIGKLYTMQGKKLEEIPSLPAGDIGVLAKISSLKTNDTISQFDKPISYEPLQLPSPVHMLAISAVNKKEEDKLNELLNRAAEEDLTFRVSYNPETRETVIAGMGEQQINMILDKIKSQSKIAAETRIPRVAYRETITKKATAEYTHKKQTGGHGQYARVVFEIEPLERGKDYEFENRIFGGAVSKGFMPGIEKGIHQAMEAGVLAGYPVVDTKTAIIDGKEHTVDSSEMAFKLAARGAFREAMKLASPVLLEPIMNLSVFVEDKYLGDVMSDLSGRRGKISGQNPIGGGIVQIDAQVPQAELLRYAIDLRSMTSGTGSFEVEFSHYAPISGKIAEDVIKAAQAFKIQEAEEE